MPTVVLVDDHEVVRRGMQFLLDAESDLSIVGEATD
ncbi:MAG: response regulator transcription factor, partial [Planctomycetes bacterium]|nr:response regulator transcription factor [Planctomycetota bacterium]